MGVENTTDFPTLVQTRSGSRVKEIRFPFLSLPKMKAPLVLKQYEISFIITENSLNDNRRYYMYSEDRKIPIVS